MAMAKPKRPSMGGSVIGDLTGAGGDMPPEEDAPTEDEFSPDAEAKAAFAEMCQAIRDGDDEAAWAAFQEASELAGGGAPADLMGG
jgi:hypothetical protein